MVKFRENPICTIELILWTKDQSSLILRIERKKLSSTLFWNPYTPIYMWVERHHRDVGAVRGGRSATISSARKHRCPENKLRLFQVLVDVITLISFSSASSPCSLPCNLLLNSLFSSSRTMIRFLMKSFSKYTFLKVGTFTTFEWM